jgi:hypothetical protein
VEWRKDTIPIPTSMGSASSPFCHQKTGISAGYFFCTRQDDTLFLIVIVIPHLMRDLKYKIPAFAGMTLFTFFQKSKANSPQ